MYLDHYKLGEDLSAFLKARNEELDDFLKGDEQRPLVGVEISVSMYFKKRRVIDPLIRRHCWVVGSIHTYQSPENFCDQLSFYASQIDHIAHPFQYNLEDDEPVEVATLNRFVSILKQHNLPYEFNQRHLRKNEASQAFVTHMLKELPDMALTSTDSHHDQKQYQLVRFLAENYWSKLMDAKRAQTFIQRSIENREKITSDWNF